MRSHTDLVLPRFSHALLVFGGAVKGLSEIMQQEEESFAGKGPEASLLMAPQLCLMGAPFLPSEVAHRPREGGHPVGFFCSSH